MTTVKLANGYTITTEVKDITTHDRVGLLDLTTTKRKRVAQVWDADGVYEHGLALPLMDLSLDEDEAIQDLTQRIEWLVEHYRKSEEEYKAFVARMAGHD